MYETSEYFLPREFQRISNVPVGKRGSDFSFTPWLQPGDTNGQSKSPTVLTVFPEEVHSWSMDIELLAQTNFSQKCHTRKSNRPEANR